MYLSYKTNILIFVARIFTTRIPKKSKNIKLTLFYTPQKSVTCLTGHLQVHHLLLLSTCGSQLTPATRQDINFTAICHDVEKEKKKVATTTTALLKAWHIWAIWPNTIAITSVSIVVAFRSRLLWLVFGQDFQMCHKMLTATFNFVQQHK